MKTRDFILLVIAIVIGVGIVAGIAYVIGSDAIKKQISGSSWLGVISSLFSPSTPAATTPAAST